LLMFLIIINHSKYFKEVAIKVNKLLINYYA